MSDKVLKCDKRIDAFKAKAKMLGIDSIEQCNLLTAMFGNRIEFCYKQDMPWEQDGIQLSIKDKSLISVEVPDIDGYKANNFIDIPYKASLVSVKLPKSIESIDLSKAYWINQIDRLFMYDTTRIISLDRHSGYDRHKLTLIVLSTTGGKNKIYNI